MDDANSLTNHFLIAMPNLADPNFFHTVTYICNHDEQGAMGITLNRPINVSLGELLDQLDMSTDDPEIANIPIFAGGPVQPERGFVLHENFGNWEASMPVTQNITLTMSQDVIEAIALNEGPQRYIISLGYAGWGEEQLEQELLSNAWLNGEADYNIIFDIPADQQWTRAAKHLGVELSLISSEAGHA